MVLDADLLDTEHYKVRIKGKVEQSREKSSALPSTFGSLSTMVTQLYLLYWRIKLLKF